MNIQATECAALPSIRILKIEAGGDAWRGTIKPKIRLMGRWLERAGFKPDAHVTVRCIAPGVIELHSDAFGVPAVSSTVSESASDRGEKFTKILAGFSE